MNVLDFGQRSTFDPQQVEDALRKDGERRFKAVLAVQVDTSTSVLNDIGLLRQALDNAQHPALLMADNMASMGCEKFHMDELGVDITTAGSQKGLMTPPGVGFVWVNEKAKEAQKTAKCANPNSE